MLYDEHKVFGHFLRKITHEESSRVKKTAKVFKTSSKKYENFLLKLFIRNSRDRRNSELFEEDE